MKAISNVANLKQAHALLESGRTMGKIVLSGVQPSQKEESMETPISLLKEYDLLMVACSSVTCFQQKES
jgi:hypothetical protein